MGALLLADQIETLGPVVRRDLRDLGVPPAPGHALKCLCLVTRSLDPTGTCRTRWAMRWKAALNASAITFGDRFPAAEAY